MSYLRKHHHWFRHWVGDRCKSSAEFNVTDGDLLLHRYRRIEDKLGSRDCEDIMLVEIKTGREELRPNQRDTLSVFNQCIEALAPQQTTPIGVKGRTAFIEPGDKKIVWHGVHLLRVPKQRQPAGPWYWDGQRICTATLIAVLNMDNDPKQPERTLDIHRRHKKAKPMPLFNDQNSD